MVRWSILTLRDAGVELIDCVHKTPAAQEDGYPYVGIPQMKDGWIDFGSARKISREDFVEWTKKAKPQQHDVVLSRRTNPGVTAIDRTSTDFALGQNLVLLRADGRQIDPPFLKWLVRTPAWWEQIDKFINVGAVFNSLKCADVPNFELPVPPIGAQQRMGSLLDAIDTKIDLNRRMNETLEAMARAIFKDWFVDFGPTRAKAKGRAPYLAPELWNLFPDALDDDGRPVGWKVSLLGDRIEVLDSKRIPLSSRERKQRQGPYPYHGATGVMDYVDEFLFEGVHVLLGEDGSVVKPDGRPFTQYVWGQFWVNNHAHVLRGKGISNEMLLCFLQQADISPYVTGAVQPKLNQKNLKTMPFSAFGSDTHAAFERVVGPLFQQFRRNDEESRTLAETRDLLLPKLMSGKIHLTQAENVVEGAA